MVGFQPWGEKILFITNDDSIESLWWLMELINIWRIPVLFMTSGMGVFFAMERRNWVELLFDRTMRIFVPLVFGSVFIVPIYFVLFFQYYEKPLAYWPGSGHLWFLGHIFLYVIVLLPLFWQIKKNPENWFTKLGSLVLGLPLGTLFLFAVPMILETILINPEDYSNFTLWSVTPYHGLIVGGSCFFLGYFFVSLGEGFWFSLRRLKYVTVVSALSLYFLRISSIELTQMVENLLTSFESVCWILSVFGFGSAYLNRRTKLLQYLSGAVYPVYVVHMPVQFFMASLVFPLEISPFGKLALMLFLTYGGGLFLFEIIKRLKWIRAGFGMKP
jgi:hypothetical protein